MQQVLMNSDMSTMDVERPGSDNQVVEKSGKRKFAIREFNDKDCLPLAVWGKFNST